MTNLPIPDESLSMLDRCLAPDHGVHGPECVAAIARPVLIAYLREKSKQHAGTDWDYAFLHCIDELEAGR
jgi:hypothetical protein